MIWHTLFLVLMTTLTVLEAAVDGPAAGPVLGAGVHERLGELVPATLQFQDQDGRQRHLAEFFDGQHPVLLIPAYYNCPMLCGIVLTSAVDATRHIDLKPGAEYRIVVVSFNPDDRPSEALRKQHAVLNGMAGDPRFTAQTWPFLCGSQENITPLLSAIGEQVQREDGTYAHPAIMVVLTGTGVISRYLYGIDTKARDLRFALIEASAGRIGSLTDRVLLYCYQYDPATHRYGLFVVGFMRIGAVVLLVGSFLLIWMLVRSTRRRARA